ncbi:MAG TPA: thioredoxin family protein [Candidatus Woesebacteria bacterium]|nr:thioredoxin family protein [Candidatus Woesebacteria bacterium]HNS95221.1 thioredoxin family protein [Candidatus Woesebacteria bacterium]
MGKTIMITIGIIALIVMGLFALNRETSKTNEVVSNVSVMQSETSRNESSLSEQPTAQETVTTTAGSYQVYSAEKIALAATNDVVMFFHAAWCPSCRALSQDIEQNLSAIPSGVVILKVDYDSETELKKKYGVTTQHTLVQVDQDGNQIKKWNGSPRLENLLSQIQ